MPRRNRNPNGPAVASLVVSAKPKNPKKKRVGKTVGNFQCTNEDCRKSWTSAHAWTSERFHCETCKAFAKVVSFVDEDCELDSYNCNGCGEMWQAIHDSKTTSQKCYCGVDVVKNAEIQTRFGRHFFYRCKGRGCGAEWEDFYQGKEYSQRCTKCGSAGKMFSVSKVQVTANGEPIRHGRPGFFDGGGGHNVEGCDMCQILIAQGVSRSCKRKTLVVFEQNYDNDGVMTERVVMTK